MESMAEKDVFAFRLSQPCFFDFEIAHIMFILLKHDVCILLFPQILIRESMRLMSILHVHLTDIITFRLVQYPRSHEHLLR
jgi:hypothetical protein